MSLSLEELRKQIDEIDQGILDLLNERARVVQAVGHLKSQTSAAVYVPERETTLHRSLRQKNSGPMTNEGVNAVFREIVSACRSLESPLRVAYLGPEGSYTFSAALAKFGSQCQFEPYPNFSDVFLAVEKQTCQYGVVAIENSLHGVVPATLDAFLESQLQICAEIYWKISHQLLSHTPLNGIRRIYSHGQAFAQCRNWLSANLPTAECIEVGSTSSGVQHAMHEKHSAAISSEVASEIYKIPIVAANIEDRSDNMTRFVVISKDGTQPTGKDKTSLLLLVLDKPGALFDALEPFQLSKINLTHIESRPNRKESWKYIFFLEFEGHVRQEPIKAVIPQLREHSLMVKVIGSYPQEIIPQQPDEGSLSL